MLKVNIESPVLITDKGNILLSKIGVILETAHQVWGRRDVYTSITSGGYVRKAYRVNNQLEAVGEPYTND